MEHFDVKHSLLSADLLKNAVGMQDFSRLVHICHYLLETQHIEGDIVEFGCNRGNTVKLMSVITPKQIYAYDSFEGLPSGENMGDGRQMAVSQEAMVANFAKDGIRLPHIHKAWFSELSSQDLPDKIAFAHLDGDMYVSTIEALSLIYDRLTPGAAVLVDDYDQPVLPGVRKAVDEFMVDKPEQITLLKGLNGHPSYKAIFFKS